MKTYTAWKPMKVCSPSGNEGWQAQCICVETGAVHSDSMIYSREQHCQVGCDKANKNRSDTDVPFNGKITP